MSGFKSFSQNTTNHANTIKAEANEHSEVNAPTETQPSQTSGSENDLSGNNDQPDPNNK
ncbi:hypothetical protein QSV37_08260 [Acinetobacter sp. VNK23]|uniref:hypothetical protein n=1 Tax=Acinetobacter TaxID=469 RepID=UPI002578C526|nr:hypothetical protein [Acinetobacter thutiue]MDM1020297.1 hypothetical protein [Acinetobacter thutiue]